MGNLARAAIGAALLLGASSAVVVAGGSGSGSASASGSGSASASGSGSASASGSGSGSSKYGTIGHGAGTSSGYGVGGGGACGGGGRRSQSVPSIRVGDGTVKGPLDKAIVRRYLKRNANKLLYCYEKALLAKPELGGTVTVAFQISVAGLVPDAKAKGVDPDVASCVGAVIKAIEFPKPKGKPVDVSYPLQFRPTGGD